MKILCDEEGRKAIVILCDIALKVGGLQNNVGVNQTLSSLETMLESSKPPESSPPVEVEVPDKEEEK